MLNQNVGIDISLIKVVHMIAIALSRFVSHANGQKYINILQKFLIYIFLKANVFFKFLLL